MLAIERLETKKIVREIKIKELSKQTMKMYAHRITKFKNWTVKTIMKVKETKIVRKTNRKIEEILRNAIKFGIISILIALTMMEKFIDFILEQRTANEKIHIQEEKFELIDIILDESEKPKVGIQEIAEIEIEEEAIVESCDLSEAEVSHHKESEIEEYIHYDADSEDGEYDSDDEYVSEDEEDEEDEEEEEEEKDEEKKFPNLESNSPESESQEEHILKEEDYENDSDDLESSDSSDFSDSDSEYEYVPTEKEKQLEKEAAEAAKKEEIDPEEIEEEKKMERLMTLEKEIKNRLSKINAFN